MIAKDSGFVALVTGATGFIGRRLAERLIEEGWSVRLLVRNPDKLTKKLQSLQNIVVGDLNDQEAVARAVMNINVIFHCAANVNSWDSWDSYYADNVLGVKNLMNAIIKENPGLSRLVHLSTVDVYGFPESPCDETYSTTGNGFSYGETKLLGESIVKEYGDRAGISYTIIRPANVIGPGSQFIERIGAELKSGIMLMVDGGRSNAGLVYVDNLVDYLIWSACAVKAHGECYNVRDNYDVTWAVFLDRLRTDIGGKGVIVNLPFPVANVIAWGFENFYAVFHISSEPLLHRLLVRFFGKTCGHSAKKIQSDSGYVAKVGFDEAMERSCHWFLGQFAR
jgi:nucleoside-diphosphate-sugar epimerase